MQRISTRLQDFTSHELQADEFLNAAEASFKSVSFSLISALGDEPTDGHLATTITPLRILDPLFWTMEKSLAGPKRTAKRWWQRLTK